MLTKEATNQKVQQLTKKLSELLELRELAKYGCKEDLLTALRNDPEASRKILEVAFEVHLENVSTSPSKLAKLQSLSFFSSYEGLFNELKEDPEVIREAIETVYQHYREGIVLHSGVTAPKEVSMLFSNN